MTNKFDVEFNELLSKSTSVHKKMWALSNKILVVKGLQLLASPNADHEKFFVRDCDGEIQFVDSKFFHGIIGSANANRLADILGCERLRCPDTKNGKYSGKTMYAKKQKEDSSGF